MVEPPAEPRSRPVLLAIDGNSLVHRAFHAQASTGLRGRDGRPLWALRGLLTQLVAAVERIGPSAVLVGFDDPDHSLRKQRWPQYKAGRGDKLEALVCQLAEAVAVLQRLGLAVVVPDGLEADDVLASAARFGRGRGAETVIVTSDRDAFALIDDSTHVLRIINGGVDASPLLTARRFELMQGITPQQYRDFAALRGDPSDNLPGVRGFGPKTAGRLLAALGSVPAALADLAAGGERVSAAVGPALAARLASPSARAAWELNCQVMAMHDDVPLGLDLAGGSGVLPLPADSVRAAYAECQLTWTTPAALRALAHVEGPPPEPPAQLWPGERSGTGGGRRLPPLPKKPIDHQLSLF